MPPSRALQDIIPVIGLLDDLIIVPGANSWEGSRAYGIAAGAASCAAFQCACSCMCRQDDHLPVCLPLFRSPADAGGVAHPR